MPGQLTRLSLKGWTKVGLVGIGFIVTLLTIAFIGSGKIGGEAREELQLAFAQIELGALKSEVHALFGREQFQNLKLREIAADTLLVQTPIKWGAKLGALGRNQE